MNNESETWTELGTLCELQPIQPIDSITFGDNAGKLTWKDGVMRFEGNAEESAVIFFNHVLAYHAERTKSQDTEILDYLADEQTLHRATRAILDAETAIGLSEVNPKNYQEWRLEWRKQFRLAIMKGIHAESH